MVTAGKAIVTGDGVKVIVGKGMLVGIFVSVGIEASINCVADAIGDGTELTAAPQLEIKNALSNMKHKYNFCFFCNMIFLQQH
jgi:hypothetical protein